MARRYIFTLSVTKAVKRREWLLHIWLSGDVANPSSSVLLAVRFFRYDLDKHSFYRREHLKSGVFDDLLYQ